MICQSSAQSLNHLASRKAPTFLKQSRRAIRVMARTLFALTVAGAAHVQGTMDFSGAYAHGDLWGYIPLHPSLTEIVLKWSRQVVPTEEGWVFANRRKNRRYYPTEIHRQHLRPVGLLCGGMSYGWGVLGVWCNQKQKTGNGVGMPLHQIRVKNSGKYEASAGTRSATLIVRGWTRPELR